MPKKGSSKYGVPQRLPDGRWNPDYSLARNRAKGMLPRGAKLRGSGRFGVPAFTIDGHRNPEYNRKQRRRWKEEVIFYYSGGTMACANPYGQHNNEPYTDIRALQIDHLLSDGSKQKRTLKFEDGSALYRWLIKNAFPKGYQVLCANCNWVKRAEGAEY